MAATVQDLLIEQGATFHRTALVTDGSTPTNPVDLSVYTIARGYIKTNAQSPIVVVAFTVEITDPVNGLVSISLTAAQTSGIPATGSKYSAYTVYQYDIELEDGDGNVLRLLNGKVQVSPEVTK